jgi:hypothetical protein
MMSVAIMHALCLRNILSISFVFIPSTEGEGKVKRRQKLHNERKTAYEKTE